MSEVKVVVLFPLYWAVFSPPHLQNEQCGVIVLMDRGSWAEKYSRLLDLRVRVVRGSMSHYAGYLEKRETGGVDCEIRKRCILSEREM